MLFSYSVVAVDPILLWQLAHFRCGSWRIFPIIVSICTIQRLMAQNYKIASIV